MIDDQASDSRLLQALQVQDVRGLELLYDRYSRPAFGLAYRILNDAGAAEDVLQEAFLNLWRQAPRYDASRGAVRTWLLAIVHHRAIDALRARRARRGGPSLDELDLELIEPDAWQSVSSNLDRQQVRQVLAQLPAEQRQTIELAYFAGFTQPEIAAMMQVPLTTVKGRMRMAMAKLRTLLEGAPAWAIS
jgi:RNA polymerase sigma-70 factor (ECF subfamily)